MRAVHAGQRVRRHPRPHRPGLRHRHRDADAAGQGPRLRGREGRDDAAAPFSRASSARASSGSKSSGTTSTSTSGCRLGAPPQRFRVGPFDRCAIASPSPSSVSGNIGKTLAEHLRGAALPVVRRVGVQPRGPVEVVGEQLHPAHAVHRLAAELVAVRVPVAAAEQLRRVHRRVADDDELPLAACSGGARRARAPGRGSSRSRRPCRRCSCGNSTS